MTIIYDKKKYELLNLDFNQNEPIDFISFSLFHRIIENNVQSTTDVYNLKVQPSCRLVCFYNITVYVQTSVLLWFI